MSDKTAGETNRTAEAFEVIRQAMIDDDPSKPGSYAHSWHCNIAMCCYDAIVGVDVSHEYAHMAGNAAATRFMKMCFNVETKA